MLRAAKPRNALATAPAAIRAIRSSERSRLLQRSFSSPVAQMEDTPHGANQLSLAPGVGHGLRRRMAPDSRNGSVGNFVDDAARQRFNCLRLLGRQPSQPPAISLDYFSPDHLKLLLQADDRRQNFAFAQPRFEPCHFLCDDTLRLLRNLPPRFQVPVRNALQIVNVVQERMLNPVH